MPEYQTTTLLDLNQLQELSQGDIIPVCKSDSGVVYRSTLQNITDSIIKLLGGVDVTQFYATNNNTNDLVLAAVNGQRIQEYKEGMFVIFKAKVDSDDDLDVTIQLGNDLEPKVLHKIINNQAQGVELHANDLVIAQYTNGAFIRLNEPESVDFFANLVSTANLNQADTILVGQNDQVKKISRDNFLKVIPQQDVIQFNVNNFVQDQNIVVLKPFCNATFPAYTPNQLISFTSSVATNPNMATQIVIFGLEPKPLLDASGTTLVPLKTGDYIQAIYDADKVYGQVAGMFRVVNNVNTAQVWSNEYVVDAITYDPQGLWTEIRLKSAIGVKKPQYYPGMTATFTMPASVNNVMFDRTKGAIRLKIDDLVDYKDLGDIVGDNVPGDIIRSDTIFAQFDGTKFIKNRYNRQELNVQQQAQQLQVPMHQVVQQIQNQGAKVVTVGTNGATHTTIGAAIADLYASHGPDGKGYECEIRLMDDFVWTEFLVLKATKDTDYSWITLTGGTTTEVNPSSIPSNQNCMYHQNAGKAIKINHKFKLAGGYSVWNKKSLFNVGYSEANFLSNFNVEIPFDTNLIEWCSVIWYNGQKEYPGGQISIYEGDAITLPQKCYLMQGYYGNVYIEGRTINFTEKFFLPDQGVWRPGFLWLYNVNLNYTGGFVDQAGGWVSFMHYQESELTRHFVQFENVVFTYRYLNISFDGNCFLNNCTFKNTATQPLQQNEYYVGINFSYGTDVKIKGGDYRGTMQRQYGDIRNLNATVRFYKSNENDDNTYPLVNTTYGNIIKV